MITADGLARRTSLDAWILIGINAAPDVNAISCLKKHQKNKEMHQNSVRSHRFWELTA
jgi:hypothetical protein